MLPQVKEFKNLVGLVDELVQCKTLYQTVMVNLPFILHSKPHLWSQALGSDQTNEIVDANS